MFSTAERECGAKDEVGETSEFIFVFGIERIFLGFFFHSKDGSLSSGKASKDGVMLHFIYLILITTETFSSS